jgi:formylglycine-generating enzyme required for sulfatase activity
MKPGNIFRDRLKDGSEGPEMVVIPAGKFIMGDEIRNTHTPKHEEVSLESFAIGPYRISATQYEYFYKTTNRKKSNHRSPIVGDYSQGIKLIWDEAIAYTEWLSEQTEQQYHLPTDIEWGYAVRANRKMDYALKKYIDKNNDIVDCFDPNPFGLYNTTGPMWEWTCSELTDKYNNKKQYVKSVSRLFLPGRSGFICGRHMRRPYRWSFRVSRVISC